MEPMGNGFYRTETNKATWEVPERYQDLQSIGSGAYGLVWYENVDNLPSRNCDFTLSSDRHIWNKMTNYKLFSILE